MRASGGGFSPPFELRRVIRRLFAATPLDDAARGYVASAVAMLVREGVRARWVAPEKWHVTLAFLGRVDDARVPAIGAAFREAAKPCASFRLQLSEIGAFPDQRRPRVLWVGGREQAPEFGEAAAGLRAAFEPFGFEFDKDAMAHVTVGRSDGSVPVHAPRIDSPITMPVTRLVLYESVIGPAGARYVELETVIVGTNPRLDAKDLT